MSTLTHYTNSSKDMQSEIIKRIISSFFGKRFPDNTQRLFGQWLIADDAKGEKEIILKSLWDNSPAISTDQTHTDWKHLRKQIAVFQPAFPSFNHKWIRYAAAIVLAVILSGTSAYWLVKKQESTRFPDLVERYIPQGESQYMELSDGSGVWLNAGSLLVYPREFSGKDRSVFLSGEATFNVIPHTKKPFFVKTSHIQVEVLGTLFTVKSYPNDTEVSATLERGSISVAIKDDSSKTSILRPGEQLVYSNLNHTVQIHAIDLDLYKMERKGYLIFENASFRELITAIERRYNVSIYYDAQRYENHKYNIKFAPNEPIGEVMNILSQLVGIRYKINNTVIIIH